MLTFILSPCNVRASHRTTPPGASGSSFPPTNTPLVLANNGKIIIRISKEGLGVFTRVLYSRVTREQPTTSCRRIQRAQELFVGCGNAQNMRAPFWPRAENDQGHCEKFVTRIIVKDHATSIDSPRGVRLGLVSGERCRFRLGEHQPRPIPRSWPGGGGRTTRGHGRAGRMRVYYRRRI